MNLYETPWSVTTDKKKQFDENTGDPIERTTIWVRAKTGMHVALFHKEEEAPLAHLLASAPEMLETLKSVHKSLEVLAKAALTGKRSEELELLCLLMLQMEETMKRAEGNE